MRNQKAAMNDSATMVLVVVGVIHVVAVVSRRRCSESEEAQHVAEDDVKEGSDSDEEPRWRQRKKVTRRCLEERWDEFGGQGLRFMSFNVLADAYAYAQRHADRETLRWQRRRRELLNVIRRSKADIVFLQEADHYDDFWRPELAELGFASTFVQRDECNDGCVTAWTKNVSLVSSKPVRFDEIVKEDDRLARRYRRHNVGIVCVFEIKGRRFVASSAHLHWDPARADVKLAQMNALLQATPTGLPVIIAGDFNSLPSSPPLRLCLQGRAHIAQHYANSLGVDIKKRRRPQWRRPCDVKVACDFNLNRLCRWLRLCGVDTIIETVEQADRRCKGEDVEIATIAATEGRLLVTASKQFVQRREVMHLHYVHVTSTLSTEDAFLRVVKEARAKLTERDALSRCVRCNGVIGEANPTRAAVLRSKDVDHKIPHDPQVQLFECAGCSQIFWWSDRGTSSAARAKDLADRLRRLSEEETSDPTFEEDDDDDDDPPASSDDVVRSLVTGLSHDLGKLRSAMPIGERNGVVSNYVPDFKGQIDYLLYSEDSWILQRRRKLPTRSDLQHALGKNIFLPCRAWPSDHIAVVADLLLVEPSSPGDPQSEDSSSSSEEEEVSSSSSSSS